MFQGLTGENLLAFLNTGEFAVSATWRSTTIVGILDRPFYEAVGIETGVEVRAPVFIMREEDIPALGKHTDTITISAKNYTVTGIERDGTGLAIIKLRNG